MTSPFSDLERPPLSESDLRGTLIRPGQLWREVSVVGKTGSTNADLRAAAQAGAPHGSVLIAEQQTQGRGRRGRSWDAPARSSVTMSVLLRTGGPASPWGWLPLSAALAVCDCLTGFEVQNVGLKWPNDVLIGERKVAGILAELVGSVAVVGIGLNVSQSPGELVSDQATSLAVEGAISDRPSLIRAILRAFERYYRLWAAGDVEQLRQRYLAASKTVDRAVLITTPTVGVKGRVVDVDDAGQLVVLDGSTRHTFSAADVTHARTHS